MCEDLRISRSDGWVIAINVIFCIALPIVSGIAFGQYLDVDGDVVQPHNLNGSVTVLVMWATLLFVNFPITMQKSMYETMGITLGIVHSFAVFVCFLALMLRGEHRIHYAFFFGAMFVVGLLLSWLTICIGGRVEGLREQRAKESS